MQPLPLICGHFESIGAMAGVAGWLQVSASFSPSKGHSVQGEGLQTFLLYNYGCWTQA